MAKLFSMAEVVHNNNINVILVQIDEAHSTAWPMSINDTLKIDQPEPQKTFDDRVNRANYFIDNYHPPYPVYIDTWNNDFAEMFRAWPDKYHCIDNDLKVIAKADYYTDDDKEATIIEECTVVLEKLIKKVK